jgi:hypothetical protein
VVLGFFTFAATLTIGALLALFVLGAEFAFQDDSWRTSIGMDIFLLLAGGVGAFMAGAVCRPLGGSPKIVPIFAFTTLLTLSLWLYMRASAANPDTARDAGVANMSNGFNLAVWGPVANFGLPLVAFVMAYLGGRLANKIQVALFGR